ncbi:MAG: RMD1 family protein [Rhodocyclaceae bacterium]
MTSLDDNESKPAVFAPWVAEHVPARPAKMLVSATRFKASAVMIAERIDTKALGHLPVVAQMPFMVRLPGGGVAAIFRYGALVTLGEEPGDREWLLGAIAGAMSGAGDPGTEEEEWVEIVSTDGEGPSGEVVRMRDAGRERLQLLSEALAKATLLSFYERRAAADFDRIEPLARDLADDGKFSVNTRTLLKAVGNMLLSEHQLTGRAEVMDKPELLWENPALEGLYARLEGEFELRDRAIALERKLGTLSKTAEILVETVRHKSSHRVEWYIVALIVIEIFLTLYTDFLH